MKVRLGIRLAVATGACCCEQVDAVSGVLPLARTLERMEGGWPSVDPGLGPEWTIGEDGAYRR